MRSRRWTLTVVTVLALGLTVTDSGTPPAAASSDDVHVRVDLRAGTQLGHVPVTGTAGARGTVVQHRGGVAVAVASRSGQGTAADFPPARRGSQAPAAVIAVRPPAGSAALAPGTRAFSFGADFRLDAGSTGIDGGDNLVQRGLADDTGQYKLELDGQRAACVIKGNRGKVTVRSTLTVTRGAWYTAECRRSGDTVSLTVRRIGGTSVTTTARGATGSVVTARADTPLSIGGKLTPAGKVATWSSDQFNGLVDNAFLRID
ncbi:hypothetical protein GXB85_16870 [Cellulomonas sp. APG4]|uniref:LamG domain-containing protein n=1 Tax=Cellulomonas sp. APG4 TaxID=1538656 RepID=UPI001379870C|nr:LamG domain-containing protein [Cellulomonas sp. APG4]NCT92609.1 hypothetical protein [Cellulomonas sp. APG4]